MSGKSSKFTDESEDPVDTEGENKMSIDRFDK